MKKFLTFFLLLILVVSITSCGKQSEELTISAAISLQAPLDEIKLNYEKEFPNEKVNISYGGSGTLRSQIENGAPTDIFFSANTTDMDKLIEKEFVKKESVIIPLTNTLVLIANNDIKLNTINDLKSFDVKTIATTDPNTAAVGEYTIQALNYYGILDSVVQKFVYAQNVSACISWVESGNADTAFVYKSDVHSNKNLYIVEELLPEATDPINYSVGITYSSQKDETAQKFIEYVTSEKSNEVFASYGFTPNSVAAK